MAGWNEGNRPSDRMGGFPGQACHTVIPPCISFLFSIFSINHSDKLLLFRLDFLGNIVAFEAAGADLQRDGCSRKFSLYFYQVWFPCPAGMILGVADFIAGDCVFSADIASP